MFVIQLKYFPKLEKRHKVNSPVRNTKVLNTILKSSSFDEYFDFSIICPEHEGRTMSIWTIISKVRLEAFMWVS